MCNVIYTLQILIATSWRYYFLLGILYMRSTKIAHRLHYSP